jgi:hypothetical protein
MDDRVSRSTADLTDRTGLRVVSSKRGAKARACTLEAEVRPQTAGSSAAASQHSDDHCADAVERRQRQLRLWLASCDGEVELRTCECSTVAGKLVAVDADQAHLVISELTTPMGIYPSAVVRSDDMLFAELGGLWRLSCPLPTPPSWIEADAPIPPHATPPSESPPSPEHRQQKQKQQRQQQQQPQGRGPAQEPEQGETALRSFEEQPPDGVVEKYFVQRYMLFSRYDDGVLLDAEGWYSVTPEVVAGHIAERCRCDLVVDAFTGVGGNAIQFAFTCEHVVAVDLDAARLRLARHNAAVYGVADRIEWLNTDFFQLSADACHADVVFLSPPWGGPEYLRAPRFDVRTMMGGLDGVAILRHALRIAPNVCYFLPRNADEAQVVLLAREMGCKLEMERCRLNGHEKALVAYFGFDDEDSM